MKILHVSESDGPGGAGIAAYRIHESLLSAGFQSRMLVGRKSLHNTADVQNYWENYANLICSTRSKIGQLVCSLQRSNYSFYRSVSILPSSIADYINSSDADIVHMHWVQGEFVPIESFGRIEKPIVWSLHDSWLFCGSEHHPDSGSSWRNQEGYSNRRPAGHMGIDIDRWCWERKRKQFTAPMNAISPSSWMTEQAKKSYLLQNANIRTISHPIDVSLFKPRSSSLTSSKLRLVYAGSQTKNDGNKGWRTFLEVCFTLRQLGMHLDISHFGATPKEAKTDIHIKRLEINFIGRVTSNAKLSELYSQNDIFLSLSEIESFGLVAQEAQACGLAVIALDRSGLRDVVEDGATGFLVKDKEGVLCAIMNLFNDRHLLQAFKQGARERSIRIWNYSLIAKEFIDAYSHAISSHKRLTTFERA